MRSLDTQEDATIQYPRCSNMIFLIGVILSARQTKLQLAKRQKRTSQINFSNSVIPLTG